MVDLVYPAENRKLASDIAQKGLLISEYSMASSAYAQNFPTRNRIISGMSVRASWWRRRTIQRLLHHHGENGPRTATRSLRRTRQHHE